MAIILRGRDIPPDLMDFFEAISSPNLLNTWTIGTEPSALPHYATFPQALVMPMIQAATSEYGVCPKCGAPWARVIELKPMIIDYGPKTLAKRATGLRTQVGGTVVSDRDCKTLGWRPTCNCDAGEPVPATVLDPFMGSGTTLIAALKLGRNALGIELSSAYCRMARRRIEAEAGLMVGEHATGT